MYPWLWGACILRRNWPPSSLFVLGFILDTKIADMYFSTFLLFITCLTLSLHCIFSFNSTLVKFSQNAKAVQVNKKLAVLLFLCFYMATLWLLKHSWTHLVLSYFSGFRAAGARRTFLADIVLEQIGNFKNSGSIYWASEVWCATKWDNLSCIQFSAELCSHTVKSKH